MRQLKSILLLGLALGGPVGCSDTNEGSITEPLLECAFGAPTRLSPGESATLTGSGQHCIEAVTASTYVIVPFGAAPRDTALRFSVQLYGGGFAPLPPEQIASLGLTQPAPEAAGVIAATDALHSALRERERSLDMAPGRETLHALREPAMPANLEIGSLVDINVSTSCDVADVRTGRVLADGEHGAVVVDTANPVGGFENSDWQQFAREYDELVHPNITDAFGDGTDIDGNGRAILFFTRAVNEVVPPGSIGIAGGFFWSGDLFPRQGLPGRTAPCPNSNEAEILYLAVPDPEGVVRVPISTATLRQVMTATIGHELQHLINGGRRLYITNAPSFEETWLNEAMSYMAEELLFFAESGIEPRRNVSVADVLSSQQRTDAFNRFAYSNLGRLNVFLLAAHNASPIGVNSIPTRGAAWSLLRYIADRHTGSDTALLRALVDAQLTGLDNIAAAIGADPLEWMADWSISLLVDDFVDGVAERFQQPSWKTRELIAALRIDNAYPLRLLPLENGPGLTVELQPGGAAYPVFQLREGTRAILFLGTEEGAPVKSTLMRIR